MVDAVFDLKARMLGALTDDNYVKSLYANQTIAAAAPDAAWQPPGAASQVAGRLFRPPQLRKPLVLSRLASSQVAESARHRDESPSRAERVATLSKEELLEALQLG